LSAEAGSGAGDRFGHSVTISGDNIAVGATYESSNAIGTGGDDTNDLAFRAGAVYVFGRNGSSWLRTAYLKASNTEASDEFGFSVSMDGGILLVGAFGEDSAALDIDGLQTNGAAESGAAYLFTKYGSTWVQKSYIKASNTNASDRFGNSVALSGGYFIVGAVGEASATDDPANNAAVNAGAAYTYTAQPGIFSICKSGLSASGGVDLAFSTLGQSAIGNFVFSEVGLQGTGASGGRNRALYGFGTSGPFSASVLQSGASLAGLTGLPAGSKLSAVFGPVSNELPLGSALFQGTVTGPGLSSSNNRILFGFDGELKALCRTGVAVPELSAAKPKTYQDVIHSRNGGIGLSYLLSSGAGVTSSNDSGILGLAPNGSVVDSSAREGQIAFGGGGNFGQFSGRAVAVATSDDLYFIAKFIPTGSAPVDALFKMGFFDIDSRSTPLQGQLAGGVSAGERYGAFTGATSFVLGALLRATLTSSPVSSNEGVWTDAGVLRLRKGQTLEPGVNIAKILRVWGLNSGQIIAQVMLSGTAVTSSNNQALILRQLVGVNPIYLMRTGSPAPGIGLASVTVASIQAVDVHPSGDYAVLGSLKGGLAAANQVLWTGDTSLGNDTTLSHLRLPQKRLRKGDRYTSSIGSFLPITANDIIRSIALKTALDASGVGARGLAQQIDEMGLVVLTLTGDRKIQELVLLFP